MSDCDPAPSELGTKTFWDQRYDLEFQNFEEFGDEGEIWFGTSAENRIVKYLLDSKSRKDSEILDVGCGNGSVLRKLATKGFENLTGVDYCEAAVKLATGLAKQDEVDVKFEQLDILQPKMEFLERSFDVILDKGTWDAMSLSDDKDARLLGYQNFLNRTLLDRFVIFSCNFTIDELKTQFTSPHIQFDCEVPAVHSFSFGGKQGVTSAGAVFRKI